MSEHRSDASPRVKVRPNGPYVVTGGVPVSRRRMVVSEHGEPMTWQTRERISTPAAYALCRCGGSANKPFCDNTHKTKGFDGAETAPTTDYDDRARTYDCTGVVMRDDRSICEHAGFCGNRITNVWKMAKEGVTDDSIARAQLMAMIERCPSGALTYRLSATEPDVEPDLPVAICVVDDGPLFVTGGLPVTRSDGQHFEPRNRVTLCRCGGSANKPLCDGTHKTIGFQDS